MARIPYKAYDNKWKYGKGIGLTAACATGYIVFQQIQVSNSSTYVMKDGYDSPIYGIIFVAGIILFFFSSYKNKQVALDDLENKNDSKINNLFKNMDECNIVQNNHKLDISEIKVNLVDEMKNAEISFISNNIPLQQNEVYELIFSKDKLSVKIVDAIVLTSNSESAVIKCTLKNMKFLINGVEPSL